MLSKHQVENLECNTTNNVLLSPIINHHFPPIFNYKVISQKITGEHNYEVELRASFRSNQFKAFIEHFQDAMGIRDYLFGLRGYLTRDKEWVKVLRPLVAHGHMTNNVVER